MLSTSKSEYPYNQSTLYVIENGPPTSPFSLPLSIRNPGSVFRATNVSTICHLISLRLGPITMDNVRMKNKENDIAEIGPGETKLIPCNITNLGSEIKATMEISGTYKTLGITRALRKKHFTWQKDAVPPRWIEGD
ncbi:hypothetical protein PUR29_14220 [Methylobacterium ajmalii]|uniref:Uncharacterized protein n=1 Tax=Methylobacterium ajmalii TaxID=2738439 RepID=A0ABU9ZT73_9HYPH